MPGPRGGRRTGARLRKASALHRAAWPDMFDSLQAAYSELTLREFELERTAAEIEEARRLFERVIESMSEALFLLDRTGTITRVNRAAELLLDRSAEAIVGQPFAEVWPNTPIPTTPGQLLARAPDGTLSDIGLEVSTRTGPRHISVSCALVRDTFGKITGVLVVAHDVTERTLAEDAMNFLAEAGRTLTESLDLQATLANVVRLAVPRLAEWCAVDIARDDGSLEQVASAHTAVDPTAQGRPRYDPSVLHASHPVARALATAALQVIEEIPEAALGGADGERWRGLREAGLRFQAVAPLTARGRTLGVLAFAFSDPARYARPRDVVLAREFARRVALAVDNARLYERERGIAEVLQHSLLPQELPRVPGVAVAARYLPASPAAVGGDWYDVLTSPAGQIGLVMGDVAGRGVRAAVVMGKLRNALRALALQGQGPAAVLSELNRLMEPGEMATLAYMIVDPATWTARYASAGHLPLLVRAPDGRTTALTGGSLPLGGQFTGPYQDHEVTLEPGAVILLYTDGLVEDRGADLDDNLRRLERALGEAAGGNLEGLLDHALARMFEGRDRQDDVALLALWADPLDRDVLRFELPALHEGMPLLRQTLRRWVQQAGAGPEENHALAVAYGEAYSNAVEHAYGPAGGTIEVEGQRIDGGVVISVRDRGQWRTPRGRNRGRGLDLMRALVDRLEVVRTPDGTTVRLHKHLVGR